MKTIQVALLMAGALLTTAAKAQVATSEQLQQAMLYALLLDDDPGRSRLGARSIRKFYPKDEQFTDCVAERLLELTTTEPQGKAVNTVAWQVVALGELQNPRYRDTLNLVRERTKNEDLIKRIDAALKSLGTSEAAGYIPGTVDTAGKLAAAKQVLIANKKADRSAFGTIKEGANLSEVTSALGAPDSLSMWRVRTEKLVVHYVDAGLFLLSIEQGVSPRYVVVEAYPELLRVSETYMGKNFGYAQILGSAHGRALVQYFKAERRQIVADMDAMYILVRRVLELPPSEHRYDVAMDEIAIGQLTKSRDPRGKEWAALMVAKIEDNENAEKAARAAQRSAKRNSTRPGKAAPKKAAEDDIEDEADAEEKEDDQ